MSDLGKELIENQQLFLSKKAIKSFGGYASAQLRRLQNAIARDSLPQTEKEKHTVIRQPQEEKQRQSNLGLRI